MLIDDELKELLVSGEIADRTRLLVEVRLIIKDGEKHLVAFVGGAPVFHSTYPADAEHSQERAAMDYIRKNLWGAVFGLVSDLGVEAVQLPQSDNRKEVARLWAEEIGDRAKAEARRRQRDEIRRQERGARNFAPVIRDHEWRVDLLRGSLAAIVELRKSKKPLSQKAVAPIVYGREEVHELESAAAQYWRELTEGFGRPASETFKRLLAVNKTWEELTKDEKSDLNCPESGRVNRRRRKSPAKKVFSV